MLKVLANNLKTSGVNIAEDVYVRTIFNFGEGKYTDETKTHLKLTIQSTFRTVAAYDAEVDGVKVGQNAPIIENIDGLGLVAVRPFLASLMDTGATIEDINNVYKDYMVETLGIDPADITFVV